MKKKIEHFTTPIIDRIKKGVNKVKSIVEDALKMLTKTDKELLIIFLRDSLIGISVFGIIFAYDLTKHYISK